MCGIWGYCSMFSMMRGYHGKEIIMHVTCVLFWLGLQLWDSRYNTLCCYKIIILNEEWKVLDQWPNVWTSVYKSTVYRCHLELYFTVCFWRCIVANSLRLLWTVLQHEPTQQSCVVCDDILSNMLWCPVSPIFPLLMAQYNRP